MKSKKDLLLENYPMLFVSSFSENKKRGGSFVIDHGEGWLDLLGLLCRQIQQHVDWELKKNENYEVPKFTQVKEKFGCLRVYMTGNDQYVFGLIRMAEAFSMKICETCGSPGKMKTSGWLKVSCEACELKQSQKMKDSQNENTNV